MTVDPTVNVTGASVVVVEVVAWPCWTVIVGGGAVAVTVSVSVSVTVYVAGASPSAGKGPGGAPARRARARTRTGRVVVVVMDGVVDDLRVVGRVVVGLGR